jgi:hypothetical protein
MLMPKLWRDADETALERQLLKSGVDQRDVQQIRCDDCHRTPLIGERVAVYSGGKVRCELCRALHKQLPVGEQLVRHNPDGPNARVRVLRRLPV